MGNERMRKIIQDKKGLNLKNSLFALVAVSMMTIAFGLTMGEWGSVYKSGIDYDLESFEDLEGAALEGDIEKDKITSGTEVPGQNIGFEGKIFQGGFGIMGRIFNPFASVFAMIKVAQVRLGLPAYVSVGVMTMITFAIVTMIISIIFRLPRSNA